MTTVVKAIKRGAIAMNSVTASPKWTNGKKDFRFPFCQWLLRVMMRSTTMVKS